MGWCEARGYAWLPALPSTGSAFIDEETTLKAFATVKRRVEAVKFAHRMADLPSPVEHSEVGLAMRRARRANSARPKQARGLTRECLERIVAVCPDDLAGRRDAAIICVGYDSPARSYELSLLEAEHVSSDGSSVLIPRSKTDQSGQGRLAYLAHSPVRRLASGSMPVGSPAGRCSRGCTQANCRESPFQLRPFAGWSRWPQGKRPRQCGEANNMSGHSMRVGTAQDMMVTGLDHIAIMQAGGWKMVDVVARYVENAAARNLRQRRCAKLSG